MTKPSAHPYIATLDHVQEVTLHGRADLGYWQEKLKRSSLKPNSSDGSASVLISAMSSRWMGLRFREATVAVAVQQDAGKLGDACLLLAAFNSSPLLTFCERTFFRTPYQAAVLKVELPGVFEVAKGGQVLLYANKSAGPIAEESEETWEGPIYLPRDSDSDSQNVFYARLAGRTSIYPCSRHDTFNLHPHPTVPSLQDLIDSGFQPLSWHVRSKAHHARSKTYRL